MKRTRQGTDAYLVLFLLFPLFLMDVPLFGAESLGHIQIKCEPGVEIFFDGNNAGQTRADIEGLFLEDVTAGRHVLKAVKHGFLPLQTEIALEGNQVVVCEFKAFIPAFETYEEGEFSTSKTPSSLGRIIIQTLPVECTISIPALNIQNLEKTRDKRIFEQVPAGVHEVKIIAMGKMVNHKLRVLGDRTVRLMVNFVSEKITEEDVTNRESETNQGPPQSSTIARASPVPGRDEADPITGWAPLGNPPALAAPKPVPASAFPATVSPASGGQVGDVLFADDFTGQNKTRPSRWEIVKADSLGFWYLQSGEFSTGNGDNLKGGDGYSYAIISAPGSNAWTDYTIESSCWIRQANGRVLLAARWQDENNHYEGVFETFQRGRVLKIEKVQSGTRKVLETMTKGLDGSPLPALENAPSSAKSAHLRFTVSGSRLILTLEDRFTIEAEDSSFSSGSAGLGQWYHYIHFDNVVVKKASGQRSAD